MEKHPRAALVVGALLVILAFHLAVAWQSFATLARNGFLYDDSFYAFKIAENIAAGRGITFDGVHPTTGFQPLYVFLLVPLYLAAGGNLILPIYLALSLLAVFTCLTAYLIYRIAKRYVGGTASIVASAIWAFSPIVTKQSTNGLETAIASFMIAVCITYYLERIRSEANPPARRFVVLGLLLGLAVLSRIDGTFLVLVMLLDYLFVLRKRRASFRSAASLCFLPLGVLVLYGPWLVFNLIACGSPFQDSGAATRFLSLAYANYFGYGTENLSSKGPDSSFIFAHLAHSISTMKVIPPVHLFFRAADRLGAVLGSFDAFHTAGNILGFIAIMLGGIGIYRWRKAAHRSRRRELDFLFLFSAVLDGAYSTYIFGMFFFLRYYYPVYLVACIYSAFFLQDAFDWCSRRPRLFRGGVVGVAAAYALAFGYFSYSQAFRSQPVYPYYDIARWVDANTAAGEKIGVFQCGTIGYLCHREIINLDGKVNREALDAMKSGCLESYLQKEQVDVVLDHSRILEIFLREYRDEMRSSCTDVTCGSASDPSGWVAYRRPEGISGWSAGGKGGWARGGSSAAMLRMK